MKKELFYKNIGIENKTFIEDDKLISDSRVLAVLSLIDNNRRIDKIVIKIREVDGCEYGGSSSWCKKFKNLIIKIRTRESEESFLNTLVHELVHGYLKLVYPSLKYYVENMNKVIEVFDGERFKENIDKIHSSLDTAMNHAAMYLLMDELNLDAKTLFGKENARERIERDKGINNLADLDAGYAILGFLDVFYSCDLKVIEEYGRSNPELFVETEKLFIKINKVEIQSKSGYKQIADIIMNFIKEFTRSRISGIDNAENKCRKFMLKAFEEMKLMS